MSECHPEAKHSANGLCNPCYQRELRASATAKVKAKAYREANKGNRSLGEDKMRRRVRDLKRYGMTPADEYRILTAHGYACAVCSKSSQRRLCIDHDHITGEFRGFLCDQCNTGLGLLGDSIPTIERVLQYLKKTH
jgi:Recombination endonuclease VII